MSKTIDYKNAIPELLAFQDRIIELLAFLELMYRNDLNQCSEIQRELNLNGGIGSTASLDRLNGMAIATYTIIGIIEKKFDIKNYKLEIESVTN